MIDEGKDAEQGTHAELMAASSCYRRLYETQSLPPEAADEAGERLAEPAG